MCGSRDGESFSCGRLNLVDLAGSERLGRSGSDGDAVALKEAQAINGSLSALGDVMQALACRRDHVPYRWPQLSHALHSQQPHAVCAGDMTLGIPGTAS